MTLDCELARGVARPKPLGWGGQIFLPNGLFFNEWISPLKIPSYRLAKAGEQGVGWLVELMHVGLVLYILQALHLGIT